MELGEREIVYLSLHCHHQNDFCIKVGSSESHFNVSLIVKGKVTRQRPQTTAFEEKGETKQIRTDVLLLTSLTPYRLAKPTHDHSCVSPPHLILRSYVVSVDVKPQQPVTLAAACYTVSPLISLQPDWST